MMKHIVIVHSGLTGISNTSLELGRRLSSEGHSISIVSPKDHSGVRLNYPVNFVQIQPIKFITPFKSVRKIGYLRWWTHIFFNNNKITDLDEEAFKLLNLPEYKELLKELKPDHLIVDIEIHEIILLAHSLKIPFHILNPFFNLHYNFHNPPLLTDIIPGQGVLGSKIGAFITRKYYKTKTWLRVLVDKIKLSSSRRYFLRKFALKIGFPKKLMINSSFPSGFIYKGIPMFSLTQKEMEFTDDLPGELTYLGSMAYADRDNFNCSNPDFNKLNELFDQRENESKKLIYCSLSTFKPGDLDFVMKVIQAVSEIKSWMLLLSLGGQIDPNSLTIDADNVYIFNWLPQLTILKNADCNINHAGIHTINECIQFKVPMLVYSGKRFDQNGCMARIKYHDLGICGDIHRDSVSLIRDNIDELLTNSVYFDKISEFNSNQVNYHSIEISSFINPDYSLSNE